MRDLLGSYSAPAPDWDHLRRIDNDASSSESSTHNMQDAGDHLCVTTCV